MSSLKTISGGVPDDQSAVTVIKALAASLAAAAQAKIANVSWVGLRCRVRIDGADGKLRVDLRQRVGDPAISVSASRPVDDAGAASLLVADDDLKVRQRSSSCWTLRIGSCQAIDDHRR